MKLNNRIKTVGQLIEFLQTIPPDAKIKVHDWDNYNDEPFTHNGLSLPSLEEKKNGKKILHIY